MEKKYLPFSFLYLSLLNVEIKENTILVINPAMKISNIISRIGPVISDSKSMSFDIVFFTVLLSKQFGF